MWVDSHVNLHGEKFAEDLDEVMARAADVGVTEMVAISDRLDSTEEIIDVVRRFPHLWRSVGVHPHHAKDYHDLTAADLVCRAEDPRVVGIGECGLDFYYEYSERDHQAPVFQAHIEAAQETGLPLIIHSRNADEDMMAMLEAAYATRPFTPLLHCYTSGLELAEKALTMGGYVAFSGILSFKKADDVREVAKEMPLDRVILETDCPYLAPVPHRGRRCEPSFLPDVGAAFAQLHGLEIKEVAERTTENFYRLFKRVTPRATP